MTSFNGELSHETRPSISMPENELTKSWVPVDFPGAADMGGSRAEEIAINYLYPPLESAINE